MTFHVATCGFYIFFLLMKVGGILRELMAFITRVQQQEQHYLLGSCKELYFEASGVLCLGVR
jgi:hypothetical protein